MPTLRRPVAVIASSLFAAGWTLTQGFCFVPTLSRGVGVLCSSNARRSTSRCRGATEREVTQGGGLTMRGVHKKGKNGPGLTGIQRVLNTRERTEAVDEPCKVMISNLDYSITEQEVMEFCSQAGPVVAVKLIKKRYARTSKGFGFVDFNQPMSATVAIEDLNGTEFRGRVVELKPAITTKEKRIRESTRAWEQQCLEKERRAAEGYADGEQEEEAEDGRAQKEAVRAQQPKKKSSAMPASSGEFLDFIGRRVKPKPSVPTDTEE